MLRSTYDGQSAYKKVSYSNEILTPGVDWSGKITSIHQNGIYEVWKKASGTCWAGIGAARSYVPVEYWLVKLGTKHYPISKTDGPCYETLKAVSPSEIGSSGAAVRKMLIADCDEIATQEAGAASSN